LEFWPSAGRVCRIKRILIKRTKKKHCVSTIRWAAWMSTGAWLGEEVVSVVIIVAFEPVNGETIWKTEITNLFYEKIDRISFFIPRGRMGAESERS
jgi:hypothetical protein